MFIITLCFCSSKEGRFYHRYIWADSLNEIALQSNANVFAMAKSSNIIHFHLSKGTIIYISWPNLAWGLGFNLLSQHSQGGLYTLLCFYPTALKGCRGIVFTHGVRIGGWREKVCPGCISETVRCRKLILNRDIG